MVVFLVLLDTIKPKFHYLMVANISIVKAHFCPGPYQQNNPNNKPKSNSPFTNPNSNPKFKPKQIKTLKAQSAHNLN
ncbi:hypothetical protein V6Z11_A02G100100 [Gossypium hirsutum]